MRAFAARCTYEGFMQGPEAQGDLPHPAVPCCICSVMYRATQAALEREERRAVEAESRAAELEAALTQSK